MILFEKIIYFLKFHVKSIPSYLGKTKNKDLLACKRLSNLDLSTFPIEEIKAIFENGIGLPATNVTIAKDVLIGRSRTQIGLSSYKEITYLPSNKCKYYQRASIPNKSVFYGVISSDKYDINNCFLISASETTKIADPEKVFTTGFWRVKQSLKCISLIADNTFHTEKKNPLINQIREEMIKTLCKFSSPYEAQKLIRYFGKEFSKTCNQECDYLISALLSDLLFDKFGYEAILYPSVQVKGKYGLNVAIRPDVVDKKLKFEKVFEWKFGDKTQKPVIDKIAGKSFKYKKYSPII